MLKLFTSFLFGLILIFTSCHLKEKKPVFLSSGAAEDVQNFFPVTDFLKGQLHEIDTMPITPLKTISENGKTDSVWLKREDIRPFARIFLYPQIDSVKMSPFFSEKSFLDQTINAVTFTYDAKAKLPDSIQLRHWDVYIDPQNGTVRRVYLLKENHKDSSLVTTQLTWEANKWCSIRTITQKPGKDPEIKEEKMIWDFEN